ncbi:hypothetical protein BGX23_000874 [Mortierella sp. AD031]|nr:hypothetical protein BGX23_000874 [Mortierella sp. AD031]
MVKLAISALVVAQLCILQAQASHYIQWKLARGHPWIHKAGICIHNGYGMVVSDMDLFGSGVKNYGYHQNGYSVNVNWDNENVGVDSWGTYWFQQKYKDITTVIWEGCWDTTSHACSQFKARAKDECDVYLSKVKL